MRQLLAVGVKTSSCLENVQFVQEVHVRRQATCSTLQIMVELNLTHKSSSIQQHQHVL